MFASLCFDEFLVMDNDLMQAQLFRKGGNKRGKEVKVRIRERSGKSEKGRVGIVRDEKNEGREEIKKGKESVRK